MSNKDQTQEQINKGHRAKVLLEDPLLKQAFDDLLSMYREQVFKTSYKADDERLMLWLAYNMVEKVKGHLESVMLSGKLAQKELNDLVKKS